MALFRQAAKTMRPAVAGALGAPITQRFILRGRVVTQDSSARVIQDGFVCIEDENIVAVCDSNTSVPANFRDVAIIATAGTIFPGLIELHNHLAYNAVPLWKVPKRFTNRHQWLEHEPLYLRQVKYPAQLLGQNADDTYPKSVARFVECRALLGGVTTTQGLSLDKLGKAAPYYSELVRNVETSYGQSWPVATDRVLPEFSSFAEFRNLYGPLKADPLARFIMHLCEGSDADARALFDNLIDLTTGQAFVGQNFVAIHCTALETAQFTQLRPSAGIVWSPTSNFLLYGATTDVLSAVKAGIPVALGCDWAPSGTKNLLGELKIAKIVSHQLGDVFSDEELVRMVTTGPASMMGWAGFVGSIEVGKRADLLVVDTSVTNPYAALIAARESDVIAVLIGGKLRLGRPAVADPASPNTELIRVANQDMVLDLYDDPQHPLAHVLLKDSIATLIYALEHLPDLARAAQRSGEQVKSVSARAGLRLHLDMDLTAVAPAQDTPPCGPNDVEPMELDPITAVDDTTFVDRLKRNSNLPEWLRISL